MIASNDQTRLHHEVEQLQKGLPIMASPELAPSVHWTPAQEFPVHRWFRYREGYSPHLLEHFALGKSRLDPFCGCGTTLLESARQGVRSCGIDLNPLAAFVATVKTRCYSAGQRDQFATQAKRVLRTYRRTTPADLPSYHLIPKLFVPESLDVLLRMKTAIEMVGCQEIKDLLKLAWLSILEESSSVFKEGNGLKYRNKKRAPGAYLTVSDAEWIPKHFGPSIRAHVENEWRTKCEHITSDIESFRLTPGFAPSIKTGSCIEPDMLDFGIPFDLVIFSPPYANRFDYFEAFKIELWMGDFVRTQADLIALRHRSLRNNLAASAFTNRYKWSRLQPFLDAMDDKASSVQMGIKEALQGYFFDMRQLCRSLKSHLSKKSQVVIVVGNSAYAKSIVPTDALIARLSEEEGYNVRSVKVARKLHVSSQQRSALRDHQNVMRESVIVLEP